MSETKDPTPEDIRGGTLHLLVDETPVVVPATVKSDDDGDEVVVLEFDAAFQVLSTWREQDETHRDSGWTGPPDSTDPENAYLAWVDETGELQVRHADMFWDGFQTHVAFAITELLQIPVIQLAAHPIDTPEDPS